MTQLAPQQAKQQVLLHELNHRINNEFAAVISVVSLTAARTDNDDVKAALSSVTALLHHHAAVHRALQMPEHDSLIDAAAYLRKLCVAISRSQLEPRKVNLVLAPQPLRLEAERCWRLGLIVYELIINAAWHAFRCHLQRDGMEPQLLHRASAADPAIADEGDRLFVPFRVGVIESVFQNRGRPVIVFGSRDDKGVELGDFPLPAPGDFVFRRSVERRSLLRERWQGEILQIDQIDFEIGPPPSHLFDPLRGMAGEAIGADAPDYDGELRLAHGGLLQREVCFALEDGRDQR